MAERDCDHRELEFLGSQRAGEGVNRYFKCKKCRGVLIIPPEGDKAYFIKGVAESS